MFIHDAADVKSKKIGKDTRIWQYCIIFDGAEIGENCNICSYCMIESAVKVGNNVTIKSYVQLCDGVTIEDDVLIGPIHLLLMINILVQKNILKNMKKLL